MIQIFSTGDVARLLQIPAHRIAYAISTGALPEPEQRIANQRCFNCDEIQNVAKHFGVEYGTSGAVTTVKEGQ
jgi:hypothetical protein